MNYKNAWKCHKCPERSDSEGCPCWCDGIVEVNVTTREERVTRGCVFPIFMRTMTATIQASNRPAAEISAMRVEVASGLQDIGDKMSKAINGLPLLRVDVDNPGHGKIEHD